jgi:hypothetical protein
VDEKFGTPSENDHEVNRLSYMQQQPHQGGQVQNTPESQPAPQQQPGFFKRLLEKKVYDPVPPQPHCYTLDQSEPHTVLERLKPTREAAQLRIQQLDEKAKRISLQLNTAIGLQVIVGAVITGLSAISSGRSTQIATAVFGAIATILASYLAKMRGSEEPETSKVHCKELQEFIRELDAFVLDYFDVGGTLHDETIRSFRSRFEEIESRHKAKRRDVVQSKA